jgi:DNA polymerase elongation subunit (family B)
VQITEPQTDDLFVMDAEYSVEGGHKVSQPIVHLFCRTADEEFRQIDVEGFRPFFSIERSEFVERSSDVLNDRHIVGIETDLSEVVLDDSDLSRGTQDNPEQLAERLTVIANDTLVVHDPDAPETLDGTALTKIFTIEPSHVGKIRDYWDTTYEADIPFTRRFLISSGIYNGASVPADMSRVRYENWDGHSDSDARVKQLTPTECPDVRPRMLVADIEVRTNGGAVPDPANANNEITAITAFDSYTGDYAGWILTSEQWDGEHTEADFEEYVAAKCDIDLQEMGVYGHETKMLEDFHSWVTGRNFDLVTGWNSNGFDYPYIIQRSYNTSAYSIREWDMNESPFNIGDEFPDPVIEGMVTFDMLDAYKKTQYQELESYSLEDVAQAEIGVGKVDLDEESLDGAWHNQPYEFMRYNVRDVEAVIEIEQSSQLLDLYNNIRAVAGSLYNTCHHNGPTLDTLFLRMAYNEGLALPTNSVPEQGDYRGAHVFDPEPGVHENVVYPDLASLYPYILWTLNISPETMYESKEAYRADGYSDDQVFTAYIDTRDWYTVASGDSIEL